MVILSDAVIKGVPGIDGAQTRRNHKIRQAVPPPPPPHPPPLFFHAAPAVLSTVLAALAAEEALDDFTTYGYIPIESSNTAASDTLEWAWDAGIGSGLAAFLGDAPNAARLWNVSQAYRRVWDPSDPRHIFCPKTAAGAFKCPLDAALPYFLDAGGYVEGNALQVTLRGGPGPRVAV